MVALLLPRCAGDVEVARAVDVADLDVFSRFRLGDDDGVGGARPGNCDQGRSGAEKKALDVHFLTSSQNRERRSAKSSSLCRFPFYFK
jgi:hypothetical protein